MKQLFWVLLIALILSIPTHASEGTELKANDEIGSVLSQEEIDGIVVEVSDRHYNEAHQIRSEIERGQLREKTNMALNALIRIACVHLRLRGHKQEAKEILQQWETNWNGYIMRIGRDIGDHEPLSAWVSVTYLIIEGLIGPTVMEFLHLDDIFILNHAIPVVFHPCDFPMDNVSGERIVEYKRHFASGGTRNGFMPTVSFWVSYIGCVAGTYGAGFVMVCSPIGSGVEWVTKQWVAPKLSDYIWKQSCE